MTYQLEQRNRELFILHQIAEALNREVNLHAALETTLAQVAELFDLHTGWAFLIDPASEKPYLATAQNLPPALSDRCCVALEGTCYCLDTYLAGGLDNRERINVITCTRLKKLTIGTDGLRYHASIPLYAQEKRLGVLNVASSEANWWELSSENLRLLHTVGDLLSMAIERAYLFERSTQLGVMEERNRLAREIHDTLAQSLTGITLRLETADAMLENQAEQEKIRQTVQQALKLTQSSLEEARRSVMDLRAAPLAGRDLAQALTELTQEFSANHAVKVDFTVDGVSRSLPVRVEMGLYRIVQQGLANIEQHAAANQIHIDLTIAPGQVSLVVQDDGRGFDPTQIPQGHFGLIGLNERVKLLGGSLNLQTAPGEGVRVEIVIPLH